MRTTLKAQAIRLIAIFLLICASTTTVKAQISQHPELYKVKEFHNIDKDGGWITFFSCRFSTETRRK